MTTRIPFTVAFLCLQLSVFASAWTNIYNGRFVGDGSSLSNMPGVSVAAGANVTLVTNLAKTLVTVSASGATIPSGTITNGQSSVTLGTGLSVAGVSGYGNVFTLNWQPGGPPYYPGMDDVFSTVRLFGGGIGGIQMFPNPSDTTSEVTIDASGYLSTSPGYATYSWGNGHIYPADNGNYGVQRYAGSTMYSLVYGGSGAALADLPPHGGEIWKAQPMPPVYYTLVWDYAATTVTFAITNTLKRLIASGLQQVLTNNGAPLIMHADTGWGTNYRASGLLTWNTNNTPGGPPYLAAYCHSNNAKLFLGQYYTTIPTNGLVTCDNSGQSYGNITYSVVCTTPDNLCQDVVQLYNWGVDGIRPSEVLGLDGTGWWQQSCRQWAGNVLNPNGFPYNWWGYNPMFIQAIYGGHQFAPVASLAYEANSFTCDNGSPYPATSLTGIVSNVRYTWTNTAWACGKGHYMSFTGVGDPYTVMNQSIFQANLTSAALWGGQILITTNWLAGGSTYYMTSFTNANYLKVYLDSQQNPAWVANDDGIHSVWVRPLSGGAYAVAIFNTDSSQQSLGLNWTNLNPPSTFTPIQSEPVFTGGSSAQFTVTDVWNATNGPAIAGSFYNNVAAGGYQLLILTTSFLGTGLVTIPTNALASWPTVPASRGSASLVNSNGTLYELQSGANGATWVATNLIGAVH
jgi:hypothetical protein